MRPPSLAAGVLQNCASAVPKASRMGVEVFTFAGYREGSDAQATGADPSRASYGGLRAVLYNVTPLAVHHGKSRKI